MSRFAPHFTYCVPKHTLPESQPLVGSQRAPKPPLLARRETHPLTTANYRIESSRAHQGLWSVQSISTLSWNTFLNLYFLTFTWIKENHYRSFYILHLFVNYSFKAISPYSSLSFFEKKSYCLLVAVTRISSFCSNLQSSAPFFRRDDGSEGAHLQLHLSHNMPHSHFWLNKFKKGCCLSSEFC